MKRKTQNVKRKKTTHSVTCFKFLIVVFSFSFLAFNLSAANAASLYFTSSDNTFYESDTFIVEARVESSEEAINVIDGSFSFNTDTLSIRELSTGGSVFSLWAEGPSFSNDEGVVRFVGGTPNGFQGDNGLILKAVFFAMREGESRMAFDAATAAFVSDGRGTKAAIVKNPFTISVVQKPAGIAPKDEWEASKKEDVTRPEFVEATISKDSRLYNNQYFVSFFATDLDSGIAYYEIQEGDGDFKKVQSPHVLRDQGLTESVFIKAVDNAGNETIISPQVGPAPQVPFSPYIFWILILIVALIVLGVLWRVLRQKNTQQTNHNE